MRMQISSALLLAAAACGGGDAADVDAEACGHLQSGPFTSVTAGAARDATAPQVAADHMAYTTTLAVGVVGYVAFPAPAAGRYVVFTDKPVPFAVYDGAGAMVAPASMASSPTCAAVTGRHAFQLPAGTAYFALGPNMGFPFNLVVEEAGGG